MGGTAEHLKGHRFQPGNKLGGRPVGSRNRLSEVMLSLLAADAQANGAAVIARVREEEPGVWLRCMCSLLPRQVQIEKLSPLADVTDQELIEIEEMLRASRARIVRQLEASSPSLTGEEITDSFTVPVPNAADTEEK